MADDARTELPPPKLLQIRTVAVDGKAVSWQDGKILRTRALPHVVWMSFGPTPSAEWNPIRLRYKLEGWDRALARRRKQFHVYGGSLLQ